MKIDGTTNVLPPLTRTQKIICNTVMGALLIVAGIIFILSGTGVISEPPSVIAAPTVLLAVGGGLLFGAAVAKNSISMWIAGVVLSCGLVSLLAVTTSAGYANLYPIYIAAPGIGCVFSLVFAEAKLPPVKAALFFGGLAAVFSLNSSGACGWGLTGGLIAAFFGTCIILYAVCSLLHKDKE